MTEPARIQRSRAKGWRMPAGAVYVGRPTLWGNWFVEYQGTVHLVSGGRGSCLDIMREPAPADAAEAFRFFLAGRWPEGERFQTVREWRARILERLPELRSKSLACWCALDRPCHADVLLDLANREARR